MIYLIILTSGKRVYERKQESLDFEAIYTEYQNFQKVYNSLGACLSF